MQSLFLILPGLVPGEVYGIPMSGRKDSLPVRLELNAEPWDAVRIDLDEKPLKVKSLYSPTKVFPDRKLIGFHDDSIILGKGQKAIIPAQPASGKSTLMTKIGNKIIKKGTGYVTNILIDERPEEKLSGPKNSTINLSYMRSSKDILVGTLDAIGEVMKRVMNKKTDEVIFIDSLTRLVEVSNSVIQTENPDLPSGTGGVALSARKFVRQILGLGNNIKGGGSLTIIATCLVGGSSLEDVVYKDLKGVSNAELFIQKLKDTRQVDPRKSYVRQQNKIK